MSSIFFSSARKTQKLDRIGALKGGTLWGFSLFLSQNINKIEVGPSEINLIFSKKSHNAKKTERGPFRIFNISVAKHQKIEGGPLKSFKFFRKKSHNVEKN